MAISAKELPKNHTDKERFAAASSCIATEILTLLFARKRRHSTGPVLYQPPRSRSRRVPDLKVPNINWINNRSRKSFKMEQVNIEDIKLTPEDIPGASFKDSEICKLTVNQLKFWLKCRRVNQGGNKKVLYERYMLNFKVKFILT